MRRYKIWLNLLKLLDKTLPSVQHMKLVDLNFLLCFKICIVNENERRSMNDNCLYLMARRNTNLNVNNYHSIKDDLGQPQRQQPNRILNLYCYI